MGISGFSCSSASGAFRFIQFTAARGFLRLEGSTPRSFATCASTWLRSSKPNRDGSSREAESAFPKPIQFRIFASASRFGSDVMDGR